MVTSRSKREDKTVETGQTNLIDIDTIQAITFISISLVLCVLRINQKYYSYTILYVRFIWYLKLVFTVGSYTFRPISCKQSK